MPRCAPIPEHAPGLRRRSPLERRAMPRRNRAPPRQTASVRRVPWNAAAARTISWSRALSTSRHLVDVDEECFELGRARVGVSDERRERVGHPVWRLLRMEIGRDADEAPVDRDPALPDLLVTQRQLADTVGDDRPNANLAAFRVDSHHVAGLDAFLLSQTRRDLDERFGLQLNEERDLLRDVVLVFGESVRRRDDRKLVRLPETVLALRGLIVQARDRRGGDGRGEG